MESFFPELPDDALWINPQIEHFCWRLQNQVRYGGFALITGEPGAGKSVALRVAARKLSQVPDVTVGVSSDPRATSVTSIANSAISSEFLSRLTIAGAASKLCATSGSRLGSSLHRPILLIDEAQEMYPTVLSELRILSSSDFDSRCLLTVVLCGDQRLTQLFRNPEFLPIASRIRLRLNLDSKAPSELLEYLKHSLAEAGNSRLMTDELMSTLSEHALGNYRVLCNFADELLAEAVRREVPQLDQKLFLEVFPPPSSSRAQRKSAQPATRP